MKAYEYLVEFKDRAINNAKKLAREFGVLDNKTEQVSKEMGRAERKSKRLGNEFDRTGRKGFGLSKIFGGLKGAIAGVLTVTALLTFGKTLSDAGARAEQTRVSFETMLGSAERANSSIADLNQFANVTPFTNDEVVTSGRNLLAFGITTEKLIPTLRNLGDVAAGLNIPFNELSEIYGKIKVQQTVYSEDLNQLAGRGIPIFTELAEIMGVQSDQVKKLASEGKVGFAHIEKAFQNMTKEGGLFFNLMEKQSATFGGKVSTLTGKLGLLAEGYGDSVNRILTPSLEGLIKTTDRLIEANKSLGQKYKEQTDKVKRLEGDTVPLIKRYEELTGKAKLNKDEQVEVKKITEQLAGAIPSAVTKWNKYGEAIGLSTTKLKENITYSKEALKLLNKDLIEEKRDQIKDLQADASRITNTLNEIAAYGGVREQRRQQGEYFTFIKRFSDQEINDLRGNLSGITGKDGLIEALEKEIAGLSGTKKEPGGSGNNGDANGNGGGVDSNISSGIDGITAGGGKSVTINFQGGIKFAENIDITAQDLSEGLDQLEPKMREFFVRLLRGGLQTAIGG